MIRLDLDVLMERNNSTNQCSFLSKGAWCSENNVHSLSPTHVKVGNFRDVRCKRGHVVHHQRPIVVNEYHVCVSGLAFQGWLRASMRTGIFPSEWKMAKASPIFKKGKTNDPNNYRPISVISTVAKIFEKVIFEQPYNYLSSNNGLLRYCQSGFRALHSILTALFESTS